MNITLTSSIVVFCIMGFAVRGLAQMPSAEERQILTERLAAHGSCNKECAKSLAALLFDESITNALAVIGLVKGSSKLSTSEKALSLYALLRLIKASGAKVVDSHKVCAANCDTLYSDVVELAQSGLLGPITKGRPVPDAWFDEPKVRAIWGKYFLSLTPAQMPPQFHNDRRWKEIMNTAALQMRRLS